MDVCEDESAIDYESEFLLLYGDDQAAADSSSGEVDHGAQSHQAKNAELPLQSLAQTGSGSPAVVQHAAGNDVNNELQRLRDLLNATAQEKERFKQIAETAQAHAYTKDGEIAFLRERQKQDQLRLSAVRAEQENKQREYDSSQSQRNNQYSREAQQLQTQLAFRDRELAEVETELRYLKRAQKRSAQSPSASQTSFSSRHPATPHAPACTHTHHPPPKPRERVDNPAAVSLQRLLARIDTPSPQVSLCNVALARRATMDVHGAVRTKRNHTRGPTEHHVGIHAGGVGALIDGLHALRSGADIEGTAATCAMASRLCDGLHGLSVTNARTPTGMLTTMHDIVSSLLSMVESGHTEQDTQGGPNPVVAQTLGQALRVVLALLPWRSVAHTPNSERVTFNTPLGDERPTADETEYRPLMTALLKVAASPRSGDILESIPVALDCLDLLFVVCKDDVPRSAFVSQAAPACISFASRARARSPTCALIVDRACAVLAKQLPYCKHDVHASAGRRPCLLDTACDALAWRPGTPGVVSMHFSVVQLLAMAVATRGADADSVACACDHKMIGALLQCLDKYWAELTDGGRHPRSGALTSPGLHALAIVRAALALLHHLCAIAHDFPKKVKPVRHLYGTVCPRLLYVFSSWLPALAQQHGSEFPFCTAQIVESEAQAQELVDWFEEEMS